MSIPSLRTAKSNRILGALPRAALEHIIPDLELKTLEMRQVVQALECGDQVVWAAVGGGGGDVGLVHADPVG